jgi:hypothetical protein
MRPNLVNQQWDGPLQHKTMDKTGEVHHLMVREPHQHRIRGTGVRQPGTAHREAPRKAHQPRPQLAPNGQVKITLLPHGPELPTMRRIGPPLRVPTFRNHK